MEAVLLIEDSRDRSREARLVPPGRSVLVGRAAEADLRLASQSIAPLHVRLTFDGRNLWAEDLETQTGSWLGQRLLTPGRPEAMREAEPLQLGEFRLSLTTSPTERQCALPLSGPQPSQGGFDERMQLSARAVEALHQRDMAFQVNAVFPAAAPHPAIAPPAAHPALAAPVRPPVLGTMVVANAVPNAAPVPVAAASLDAPPPPEASSPGAGPVVFPAQMVSARQTMALEPTVLAALENTGNGPSLQPRGPALAGTPRSSGHTAIIAAARPEPGAGSLTFSGFSLEGRESLAPQALASAARGRPIEQGARSSSSRDRSAGHGGSGRVSSSSSARRSGAASARSSAPRRRVVRQRGSVWPFLFLGAVVLGLGGVAANLFLHGELPWAHKPAAVLDTPVEEPREAAPPPSPPKPSAAATPTKPLTKPLTKPTGQAPATPPPPHAKTKVSKAAHGRERPHRSTGHATPGAL